MTDTKTDLAALEALAQRKAEAQAALDAFVGNDYGAPAFILAAHASADADGAFSDALDAAAPALLVELRAARELAAACERLDARGACGEMLDLFTAAGGWRTPDAVTATTLRALLLALGAE